MPTNSSGGGLLPLNPYEPVRHDDRTPRAAVAAGQLSLDDLLAEVPAQRAAAAPPRPELDRRRLHSLLVALLEVHTGSRPAAQLGPWLAPALQRRLRDSPRTVGPRYTLRKVHACRPAADAVEACGTAYGGGRALAVVARFQYGDGHWRCTYFGLLDPGAHRR
ncbi:Rv3235 family protein [Qaidamihabitans albus]|uniref:Rv3235 family protein n=1 Tax=Qaidamihabitans albus TaxID=2795733 RepID=UPI0018F212EC|nr:Rv3235 family protein [Qaidamihabitans albus]